MLDNTAILMIQGLPLTLWMEIHYDFGNDFFQQFPGKIAGPWLFLKHLGLPAVIEAFT